MTLSRALAAGALLWAMSLALAATAVPVGAQPDDETARWVAALNRAPLPDDDPTLLEGRNARIAEFGGPIRVPPTGTDLFETATVASASATVDREGYEIVLDLSDGVAILRGGRGRADYEQAVATAPPGCSTGTGRTRGWCYRETPHYEYFPFLDVAGNPAQVTYGGFETNYGAFADVTWYEAEAQVSYAVVLTGPEGAVARAGFGGTVPTRNAPPARRLADAASRFIAIHLP